VSDVQASAPCPRLRRFADAGRGIRSQAKQFLVGQCLLADPDDRDLPDRHRLDREHLPEILGAEERGEPIREPGKEKLPFLGLGPGQQPIASQ